MNIPFIITFNNPVDFTDGKGVHDLEGRTVTVTHLVDGVGCVQTTGLVALASHQGIWFRQDGPHDPPVGTIAWDDVGRMTVHGN